MLCGQAWPIELFQAVLLTLIFSLYRADKSVLAKAMHLRSAFITSLRELGAFKTESLADHLKTYFSGAYAPYTLSMRERFKRLLAFTYQFDAFLALAHQIPPILHRQEMGVDMLSSFTLWNTYGLDIFAKRQREELLGRSEFQICEMTNRPDSFTASQILVEDVSLGLCSLLQAIWVFSQYSPSKAKGHPSNAFQRVWLIETLDAWRRELDKINELTDPRNITSHAARRLLLAYRGEDDSVAASLERITILVHDGMVLYYYLKMHHYAGLNATEVIGVAEQAEDFGPKPGRLSKDEREALVLALQILKMAEATGASAVSQNPLIPHALTRCANLTKVLISRQKCECLTKEGQHGTEMNPPQWTETGGPIWIDGTQVCPCRFKYWTERFDKAIQDRRSRVE